MSEEVFYCEYCHMTEQCDEECECDECMLAKGEAHEELMRDTFD